MGERREYPAFLVNNGPAAVSFDVNLVKGVLSLEEDGDVEITY